MSSFFLLCLPQKQTNSKTGTLKNTRFPAPEGKKGGPTRVPSKTTNTSRPGVTGGWVCRVGRIFARMAGAMALYRGSQDLGCGAKINQKGLVDLHGLCLEAAPGTHRCWEPQPMAPPLFGASRPSQLPFADGSGEMTHKSYGHSHKSRFTLFLLCFSRLAHHLSTLL